MRVSPIRGALCTYSLIVQSYSFLKLFTYGNTSKIPIFIETDLVRLPPVERGVGSGGRRWAAESMLGPGAGSVATGQHATAGHSVCRLSHNNTYIPLVDSLTACTVAVSSTCGIVS